jgi:hypothetical protein
MPPHQQKLLVTLYWDCILCTEIRAEVLNQRNDTVTYRPIARQTISKHASLTIEPVLSAWSVQSVYKEVLSLSSSREAKRRLSIRQPAGI